MKKEILEDGEVWIAFNDSWSIWPGWVVLIGMQRMEAIYCTFYLPRQETPGAVVDVSDCVDSVWSFASTIK